MLIEPTFPSKIVAKSLVDFNNQVEELKLQGIEIRWALSEFIYSKDSSRLPDRYRKWKPIEVTIGNKRYKRDKTIVRYLSWY